MCGACQRTLTAETHDEHTHVEETITLVMDGAGCACQSVTRDVG
jgi:hypothetical protein